MYEGPTIASTPYAIATVNGEPRACTSILSEPKLPDGVSIQRSTVPEKLWAQITSTGGRVPRVNIAIPAHDAFLPLIERVVANIGKRDPSINRPIANLVDLDKPHEIAFRLEGTTVFLDIADPQLNGLGVTTLPRSIAVADVDRLLLVLDRAANFFYWLRRTNRDPTISDLVTLQAYQLAQKTIASTAIGTQNVWLPENSDAGLNDSGVMVVDDPEKVFGFSLKNRSPDPLFVSAFFFEVATLSISKYHCVRLDGCISSL